MTSKKQKYEAGCWIAIPFVEGWCLGLLIRKNRYGICLAYFVKPLCPQVPSFAEIPRFDFKNVVLTAMFAGFDIRDGRWRVVGRVEGWDPAAWPVPPFKSYDLITSRARKRLYDDELQLAVDHLPITEEEERDLPLDSSCGGFLLEVSLARILGVTKIRSAPVPIYETTAAEEKAARDSAASIYLYFQGRKLAKSALAELKKLGYQAKLQPPPTDEMTDWLVLVTYTGAVAGEEELEAEGRKLAEILAPFGCDYDGWDGPA